MVGLAKLLYGRPDTLYPKSYHSYRGSYLQIDHPTRDESNAAHHQSRTNNIPYFPIGVATIAMLTLGM